MDTKKQELRQPAPETIEHVKHLVFEFVRWRDWCSFPEIEEELASKGIDVKGAAAIEHQHNLLIWAGCSETLADAVNELLRERRIFMWPCSWPHYLGATLRLPLAKRSPARGYLRPHWLPVLLRPIPIPESDLQAVPTRRRKRRATR